MPQRLRQALGLIGECIPNWAAGVAIGAAGVPADTFEPNTTVLQRLRHSSQSSGTYLEEFGMTKRQPPHRTPDLRERTKRVNNHRAQTRAGSRQLPTG